MILVVEDHSAPDETPAGNGPLLTAEGAQQRWCGEETGPSIDLCPAESPPISWPRVLPGL
jgi:hypothetical protein